MPKGFTLIELLVVIAIIAILAGIMFPVLSQAKASGKKIACASNTRQLALGVLLYAESVDDTLPPVAYLEGDDDVLWTEMLEPHLRSERIRLCGEDSLSEHDSYGLNELAFADLTDPDDLRTQIRSATSFERPAETIMLGEAGTDEDFVTALPDTVKLTAPSYPLNDDDDARPSARHFDMVNLSFMDGHQKTMRLSTFYRGQTPEDRWFLP